MKRTTYLITLFCYLLMTAVIGRLAFLYYNRSLAFFTVKDVIKTELLGLPMDAVIASAVILVPVVLTLLSCLWPRLAMRRILGPYLWLVIFLGLCITCADFIMYEHWKFKLDASIFAYMSGRLSGRRYCRIPDAEVLLSRKGVRWKEKRPEKGEQVDSRCCLHPVRSSPDFRSDRHYR